MRRILITGSAGLIGSEAARHYDSLGDAVIGVDNNMRRNFFGADGDTTWQRDRLQQGCRNYRHAAIDIRDRTAVLDLVREVRPDVIIHAAAQPSHDLAATIPFDDFEVNAVGTLNLLQATRQTAPEASFIFTSTNKVYGDGPNLIPLVEHETRYDFADPAYANGIPESFSIDQTKHSLFGASKVAADVMVQEYGRYFGIEHRVLPRRLPDRCGSFRRAASRLSVVHLQGRGAWAALHHLWLQGKTGTRPDPQPRRDRRL